MDNPGIINVGNFAIGAAGMQIGDPVIELEGMISCNLQAQFIYGAGGSNVSVYFQTSLDQGNNWIDIACIVFTTSNGIMFVSLNDSFLTTPTAPTDGSLTANTCLNGVLGDQIRAKIISTGTYTGSTNLILRACVR